MMTSSDSTSALRRAAALGAVSGLRTFTAPGVLAARGRWGRGRVARVVPVVAAGELVGDKLPMIPPRSDPPSLLGRLASGAAAGSAAAGARGAGVGAAFAAATAYPSERLRSLIGTHTGVPDPVLGAAEDVLAIGISAWSSRGMGGETSASPSVSAEAAPSPEPGTPPPAVLTPEPPPRRPVTAVARGVAAAAVGTAAMTSVQTAYLKATHGEPSDVPAEMGQRIIRGVLRRRLPRRRRPMVNQAMHAVYGTAWGVPLGLLAGSIRRRLPAPALGAAFGLSVWGTSLVILPALKLSPPASEQPPAGLAVDLAMHLVYGGAAGAAYAALS